MKHFRLSSGVTERRGCSWWKMSACLLIGLLAAGCAETVGPVYRPTQGSVPKMSYVEAKRTITQAWQRNVQKQWEPERTPQETKVKFRKNSIEFTAINPGGCVSTWMWNVSSKPGPYVVGGWAYNEADWWPHTTWRVRIDRGGSADVCGYDGKMYHQDLGQIFFRTTAEANIFANAISAYINGDLGAADLEVAEAAFEAEAKKYREMPVKPALPEDVQRYRVAAEDAYKNKDFEKAVEYYEKGLGIEPLWPWGQLNAALLCGEIKEYESAALHMKRYLKLVPDARGAKLDAKTLREMMYLWEEKAK